MVDITRIRKKAKKIKSEKKKLKKEEKTKKIETIPEKEKELSTGKQHQSRKDARGGETVEPTISAPPVPAKSPGEIEEFKGREAIKTETRLEVEAPRAVNVDVILARLFRPVPRSLDFGRVLEKVTETVRVEGKEQFFIFQLQKEWYAIPLSELKEIVRFRPHTRMPGAPSEILGVMNLRGQMITVINSYQRLGLPSPEMWTLRHRVVMVKDGDDVMGFIIENVGRVAYIDASELLPPLMHVTRERSTYIKNIFHLDGNVISLLDLPNFLDITREPVRE